MINTNGVPAPQRRNSEQERGRQAWENIREIKQRHNDTLEKEYRSLTRRLNTMIQINGLGQTLGFLKAKGKNDSNRAQHLLLKHLTEWMRVPSHFAAENRAAIDEGDDGLLRWITDEGTDSEDYRRATVECLAFSLWLRRFAEGELQGTDDEEEQP
ncbi:MAG: type III-B CRISPR module-associated protein Cmr5 [Ktedonobacteraceae bacterium]|nr:type III-B CRISPR module-associated protein Cmr5 [Ktedonobacteraceae bacterium]